MCEPICEENHATTTTTMSIPINRYFSTNSFPMFIRSNYFCYLWPWLLYPLTLTVICALFIVLCICGCVAFHAFTQPSYTVHIHTLSFSRIAMRVLARSRTFALCPSQLLSISSKWQSIIVIRTKTISLALWAVYLSSSPFVRVPIPTHSVKRSFRVTFSVVCWLFTILYMA